MAKDKAKENNSPIVQMPVLSGNETYFQKYFILRKHKMKVAWRKAKACAPTSFGIIITTVSWASIGTNGSQEDI